MAGCAGDAGYGSSRSRASADGAQVSDPSKVVRRRRPEANSALADLRREPGRSAEVRVNSGRRLMTLRDAAQYLSVSYWTVRAWVESGRLPAVRLPGGGRLIRVEIAALDRLVDECRDN